MHLYDRDLPSEFGPLIEGLDEFLELVQELRNEGKAAGDDPRVLRLRELEAELADQARRVLTPHEEHLEPESVEASFAAGALRATYYQDTVDGDRRVVDTCGSKTLKAYAPDYQGGGGERRAVRSALTEAFDLEDEDVDAIEEGLEPELDALERRHRIIDALEQLFPLDGGAAQRDAQILRLFEHLFPGQPLREGEVELVRTNTSLFFCVPFEDGELLEGEERESADERRAVELFLEHLGQFQQRWYADFPAFSCFRGESADAELIDEVAERSGLEPDVVQRTLTTMVSILPSQKVDQYIVHDAWGHQWQALLFAFEEHYRELATFGQLPRLTKRHEVGGGETLSLLDILDRAAGISEHADGLSTDVWEEWLRAEMSDRLYKSMTGLLAEVLADALEYKFLAENQTLASELQSSSYFKELPAKLDLTIGDLPLYFQFVTGGFVAFVDGGDERERLRRAYRERRSYLPADQVDTAVSTLAELTGGWVEDAYADGFQWRETADGIDVNVFGRTALNYLGFQTILNRRFDGLIERRDASKLWDGYGDLLIFAIASFYEEAPNENFWHIDEFVEYGFPTCLERFVDVI